MLAFCDALQIADEFNVAVVITNQVSSPIPWSEYTLLLYNQDQNPEVRGAVGHVGPKRRCHVCGRSQKACWWPCKLCFQNAWAASLDG